MYEGDAERRVRTHVTRGRGRVEGTGEGLGSGGKRGDGCQDAVLDDQAQNVRVPVPPQHRLLRRSVKK